MSDTLQTLLDSLDLIIFLLLISTGYFIGRRNERRHLADLAIRERALSGVSTFATRYPPIHAIVHDPVLVSGSAVIAADSFKMFAAGLRKLLGGRFHAYETLVDRARREAVLRMKAQAQAAGCPMIFNVRVETTQLMNGNRGGSTAVEVFAYGTAFAPATGSVSESRHAYVAGPALPDKEGFDLMKNPATKGLLIGWFALIGYSFVELIGFADYWYVGEAPWIAFWLIAALFMAWAVAHVRKHKVPLFTGLFVAALVAASLPVLIFLPALRINALTDFSAPTEYLYIMQDDRRLHAQEPDLPVLSFPEHPEYWREQQPGSEHRFVVRRGLLGFWQVAREPYVSRLTAFEEEQQKTRREREREGGARQ